MSEVVIPAHLARKFYLLLRLLVPPNIIIFIVLVIRLIIIFIPTLFIIFSFLFIPSRFLVTFWVRRLHGKYIRRLGRKGQIRIFSQHRRVKK